jgi:hypothetical protein
MTNTNAIQRVLQDFNANIHTVRVDIDGLMASVNLGSRRIDIQSQKRTVDASAMKESTQ